MLIIGGGVIEDGVIVIMDGQGGESLIDEDDDGPEKEMGEMDSTVQVLNNDEGVLKFGLYMIR
jgi:hypothetical protein